MPQLISPRQAYNSAAPLYDEWSWQRFWRLSESPLVASEIAKYPRGSLLDLGTGTGYYLQLLSSPGYLSVGLDISENMLSFAKKKLGNSALLVQADAQAAPFAGRTFARLAMCRVLSHIENLDSVFSELGRLVKSSGVLVITDVHPVHAYENTRLPGASDKINVTTFKHSIKQIVESARRAGKFQRSNYIEISRESVNRLPTSDVAHRFGSSVRNPVGFVLTFVRI